MLSLSFSLSTPSLSVSAPLALPFLLTPSLSASLSRSLSLPLSPTAHALMQLQFALLPQGGKTVSATATPLPSRPLLPVPFPFIMFSMVWPLLGRQQGYWDMVNIFKAHYCIDPCCPTQCGVGLLKVRHSKISALARGVFW